jgi:hypothetical protein
MGCMVIDRTSFIGAYLLAVLFQSDSQVGNGWTVHLELTTHRALHSKVYRPPLVDARNRSSRYSETCPRGRIIRPCLLVSKSIAIYLLIAALLDHKLV